MVDERGSEERRPGSTASSDEGEAELQVWQKVSEGSLLVMGAAETRSIDAADRKDVTMRRSVSVVTDHAGRLILRSRQPYL